MNFKEMKTTTEDWTVKQIRGMQEKNLRRLYKKGLTGLQIALEVGVTNRTIYNRLKLYGIKREKDKHSKG